jgi:F420H(2)-dependent quinone reductase
VHFPTGCFVHCSALALLCTWGRQQTLAGRESLGGRPMLLLRTVGRRTSQPRTAALLYVRDGDAYVVIASKGGAPQHPGWFHNLTAQPEVEIQVGRERIPVRARIAEGEERSRLWARADEINRGQYAAYQSRASRVIPVVVLERIPTRRSGRTSESAAPARGL